MWFSAASFATAAVSMSPTTGVSPPGSEGDEK
jgi:hypothetical protein